MEKKKVILISSIAAAVVVIIGIILAVVLLNKEEEGYRAIKIYQLDGTVTLAREGLSQEMQVFENMALQSGDKVSVMDNSYTRLQMDGDKFALAEANSVFTIEATGTAESGKTDIQLEQGAVTIEIQNKLGSESSYQVTTPNSVMAVRGTVFRIAITMDEQGKPVAKLDVFEGKVTVQRVTVNDKGEKVVEEEAYVAEKGGQIVVHYSEEGEENVITVNEVPDYSDLPLETLYFLQEIVDEKDLVITEEQIQEMIEALLAEESSEEASEEESEESVEETKEVVPETEEVKETEESVVAQETVASSEEPSSSAVASSEEASSEVASSEESKPSTFTVTFSYGGSTFATQTVESGSTVSKPKLQPAQTGSWDYDFTKPITADTTIEWK